MTVPKQQAFGMLQDRPQPFSLSVHQEWLCWWRLPLGLLWPSDWGQASRFGGGVESVRVEWSVSRWGAV